MKPADTTPAARPDRVAPVQPRRRVNRSSQHEIPKWVRDLDPADAPERPLDPLVPVGLAAEIERATAGPPLPSPDELERLLVALLVRLEDPDNGLPHQLTAVAAPVIDHELDTIRRTVARGGGFVST